MKFYFSLLLSFFMITISIQGMDKYNIGDEVFVWAENGLNLRISSNVKSNVLQTLSFGTQVTVVSKTEISYNINALSNLASEKVKPLIFYGHWVEVVTESGESGFVIDQYLLKIKPINKTTNQRLEIELISRDSSYIDELQGDFTMTIKEIYKHGILLTETIDRGYDIYYSFPNFTIEEVLIIVLGNIPKDFTLQQNWKNELIMSIDDGNSVFSVYTVNNTTIVVFSSSC